MAVGDKITYIHSLVPYILDGETGNKESKEVYNKKIMGAPA